MDRTRSTGPATTVGRDAAQAGPQLLAPPVGMRDLVPPLAAGRRKLAHTVARSFAAFGYELVTTPPFEREDVIERGLDTVDRRELLRFVDSDTGEVALLRPDITPQIARVAATLLRDRPPPFRLSYEGHVIRRRRGRARRQRQIAQAGVECIGIATADADVEVIELAAHTLEHLGLHAFRIELGLSPLARTALDGVPLPSRAAAAEALSRKDRKALDALGTIVPAETLAMLREMVELWGGADVIDGARRVFRDAASQARLDALAEVHGRLAALGLGERIVLDLGEVRGFGYYTGPSFTLLAEGPGEALGGGGRYDELLGRFGAPLPATGFGLDLDHIEWALTHQGIVLRRDDTARIALHGADAHALALAARVLRNAGIVVATLPGENADAACAFVRAWGYAAEVAVEGTELRARRVRDDAVFTGSLAAPAELARWLHDEGSSHER